MAPYAHALSTETVSAAHSLKDVLWVARFFVLRPKYAMGLSSGAYDGNGCAGMRSPWPCKNGWVAGLVGYRAPSWIKKRGAVVWARMVCKHAWELSAVTRPAMPAENRRPEPYAMAPKTLYPLRLPLVVPSGGGPRQDDPTPSARVSI